MRLLLDKQASSIGECCDRILAILEKQRKSVNSLSREAKLSQYQTQSALTLLFRENKVCIVHHGKYILYERVTNGNGNNSERIA
jgi:hypothetical protein